MEVLLFFGGIGCVVAVLIASGWYLEQAKKPVEIALGEVPAIVRGEAERRVKGLVSERVLKKPAGDTYRFHGRVGGAPIQIKVQLRGKNARPHVHKIEIQRETRSSHRSLKGKHRIELSAVPAVVLQQARQAAEMYGASLEEISRVKAATVQGRKAYDIKGWSGQWRVEVELLDDGEMLELELEFRPHRI